MSRFILKQILNTFFQSESLVLSVILWTCQQLKPKCKTVFERLGNFILVLIPKVVSRSRNYLIVVAIIKNSLIGLKVVAAIDHMSIRCPKLWINRSKDLLNGRQIWTVGDSMAITKLSYDSCTTDFRFMQHDTD